MVSDREHNDWADLFRLLRRQRRRQPSTRWPGAFSFSDHFQLPRPERRFREILNLTALALRSVTVSDHWIACAVSTCNRLALSRRSSIWVSVCVYFILPVRSGPLNVEHPIEPDHS